MNEKDRRLAEFCRQRGCEGVLIHRRCNAAWITDGGDFHVDAASSLAAARLLWTPRRKVVYTDNIEAPRLRAEELPGEWEIEEAPWWQPPPAPEGRFAQDFPDDVLAPLRFELTPGEIERVRALGRDAADVMQRVLKCELAPGWSELRLAGALAGGLRARGIRAHVLLVAADERIGRFRHPLPTEAPIRGMAMAAICAQRYGLIVSITRLVRFGPPSGDLRRRHDAVCAVDEALHAATRPGVRWCDALAAGLAVYERTGFGQEWKLHHQGGPMGYECRDFKATPDETRPVLDNQLVGWNPSITGTKSEDTILSSGEVLTAMADWPMCGTRPDILVRAGT